MLYQLVRPKTFEEFFGNKQVIKALSTLKRTKPEKRPHTILLKGPTGCGKTTAARILAAEFGAHGMDIIEVNAANTKGIDTIRDIDSSACLYPFESKAKVYIIDESHELTSKAQEAFLKVLEDCPTHTYFIFCTTSPENLIKTIRNRCTEYQFSPLNRRDMAQLVTDVAKQIDFNLGEEICETIVHLSEGSPRTALVFLEQILEVGDELEMLDILCKGTEEQAGLFDLAQFLAAVPEKRAKNLKEILLTLDSVCKENDTEVVRRAILSSMYNKILRSKKTEDILDYVYVIKAFSVSTFYHGKPLLAAIVVDVCLNKGENNAK